MASMIYCECKNCPSSYCMGKNLAYIIIRRAGKELKICSRCTLSSDERLRIIPDIDINYIIKQTPSLDILDILCMKNDGERYAKEN